MSKIDKSIKVIELAAEMSEAFYQKPLIVTYSGGKDSDVILDLALESGITFEALHSHTTVDAPETVYHVRKVFQRLRDKGIKATIKYPTYKGEPTNMWKLIAEKGIPPARIKRYCCSVLKESSTPNRIIAVGVRADESINRSGRESFMTQGKTKTDAKRYSLDHAREVFEESKDRDPIWDCSLIASARSQKELICNPIYEWTNADVWEYIRSRGIAYNPLYDCGYQRVGCVLCPMAKKSEHVRDACRYPKFKDAYIRAFDKMLKIRKEKGKDDNVRKWKSGKAVYKWWVEDDGIEGQLAFDEDGNITEEI